MKGYLKKAFFGAAAFFLFIALVTPAVSAADSFASAYQAPDMSAYEPPAAPEPEVETDTPSAPIEPKPEPEYQEEGAETVEPDLEEPNVEADPDSSVNTPEPKNQGKALGKGQIHNKKTK